MDTLVSGMSALDDDGDDRHEELPSAHKRSTTPGGSREMKWVVVTKTAGLVPAEIIAQRLQAEGIPARAWQEGAGQAIGLTVGLLGDGYVIVPDSYAEQAKAILEESVEFDDLSDSEEI